LKKKVRKKIKGNETKRKEKGITPSRDRVVTDYNRDDIIGLLLPSNSLLKILALLSATSTQSPQVFVNLLEDQSLLLLLFPPVLFQGIALTGNLSLISKQ